ncbi:serine protease [Patescibacteria group bacterium]
MKKLLTKRSKIRSVIPLLLFVFLVLAGYYMYQQLQAIETRIAMIEDKFGGGEKIKCTDEEVKQRISKNVYRIIGSFSEGSGFPLSRKTVLTNFHVVDGESSPKVVFPDGGIESPTKIEAIANKDFAILTIDRTMEPMELFDYNNNFSYGGLMYGEPLYAFGYPLGSDIQGDPAVIKGVLSGTRWMDEVNMNTIESNISIVDGMSGGPLVDSCGEVVGVNSMGIGGLSMSLSIRDVLDAFTETTDESIEKIKIDTSTPEGTVEAFYTYIKARNMEKAFELISSERKETIESFEKWIQGYENTLQVDLIMVEVNEDDENRIKVKIRSQDWVDGDLVLKYFGGTWDIIEEDGVYKMHRSNIKEVFDPSWDWYYTSYES